MNLQQLQQGLGDLYPPLRTRSGQKITTEEAQAVVIDDGLAVTVKTLFPPSNRRRTELRVSDGVGVGAAGLDVRPFEPNAMADAQRFAELLRERWIREQPEARMAPLRLVRDTAGRYCFHVGPEAVGPEAAGSETSDTSTPATNPATPMAKQAKHDPDQRSTDQEHS